MKTAVKVEKVRAAQKLTYSEATKVVKERANDTASAGDRAGRDGEDSSYRERQNPAQATTSLSRPLAMTSHRHPPIMVSIGCQTTTATPAETQTGPMGDTFASSFLPDEKFCAVLIEMAGLMSATMGKKFKCIMASNLIKKHYGRVIDAEQIEDNMAGTASLDTNRKHCKRDATDNSSTSEEDSIAEERSCSMNPTAAGTGGGKGRRKVARRGQPNDHLYEEQSLPVIGVSEHGKESPIPGSTHLGGKTTKPKITNSKNNSNRNGPGQLS